jgi:hypothetical protein
MLRNGHVRFGGRAAETHQPQDWQALLSDPYTYVRSWAGFCYVAFIVDVFARRSWPGIPRPARPPSW